MRVVVFVLGLMFLGCSFTPAKNQWQYQSSSSFEQFVKYSLEGKEHIASIELKRAIQHAKSSANLEQLARIYLGAYAIKKALNQNYSLDKYHQVMEVTSSKKLQNYALMITKQFDKVDLNYLDKRYIDFIKAIQANNFVVANKFAREQKQPSSKLIMIYLLDKHLECETINEAIELFSFYGYKQAVIGALEKKIQCAATKNEQEQLKKKLKILKE